MINYAIRELNMSAERNDPLTEAREIVISLLADEKLSAGGRQKLARVAHCLGVAKSPWQAVTLWMHDPIVKVIE